MASSPVTADTQARSGPAAWLVEAALVVGVLGVLVVYAAPTLGQPLLEKHAFRQTQTAYTARIFHEEGIDLLHPQLPVLGVPFEIPFEFPLFQAGASILMDLDIDDDVAMRLTGLLCFLATALLLYGLVRHVAGRASALASLVAFTLSPFALAWSRTSMIEYLATAGAIGFTWSLIVWRESRRPVPYALALTAGLVGMLVKPTTAVFWILPALLYRPKSSVSDRRRQVVDLRTVAVVVAPLVAAAAWTRHADSVKAATRTTQWLTSDALREWNFGTLAQRLDPEVWDTISRRFVFSIVGWAWVLVLVAILAAARSRQWPFWLGVASAALLPPLVFTNLYFVHDYYLAAVTPAFAALIGLGAGYVWTLLPRNPLILASAVVVGVLLVLGTLDLDPGYWWRTERANDQQVLPLAREIEARTQPGDPVAVVGLDWSPAVLYYAHRRGHMVPPANEPFAYDLIHDQGYRYLLVADPTTADLGFLSRWRWVGAFGPHMYAIADLPSGLSRSRFVVTDASAVVRTRASGRKLVGGFRMRCGRRTRIPSGENGTWIMLKRPKARARITVSEGLAPLPARTAVFAARELADGTGLTISCTGTTSLKVVDVIDAGLPS